jgi:TatD DNase family protein
MIDIGVNLLHPQFDSDRAAVVDRARAAGVTDMLITCTELSMVAAAIELCEEFNLHCTAGVHPHDAREADTDLSDRLLHIANSPRVKAIGETGLDFNRNFSPQDVQRHVFDTQLQVARTCGLPVFVHDRDSGGGVYDLLATYTNDLAGVVVHCFTGTSQDLDRYLSLDCYIGITGWICDRKRGALLRSLISRIPLDNLLIETDAPFLLPHTTQSSWHADNAPGISKRRNEPALLPLIAAQISFETQIPMEDIISHTSRNARRLFDLPSPDHPYSDHQ